MRDQVGVAGVGMTPMNRRDLEPATMAAQAARDARPTPLSHRPTSASWSSATPWEAVSTARAASEASHGFGDSTFTRPVSSMSTTPVPVGPPPCTSGFWPPTPGESPVLVVGVEKMWIGDRLATLAGIADALPRRRAPASSKPTWGTGASSWSRTPVDVPPARRPGDDPRGDRRHCRKEPAHGSANPLAQLQSEVTDARGTRRAPVVAGSLTRLMCSSFTDGAAAAVLVSGAEAGTPRVLASTVRSGIGEPATTKGSEAWPRRPGRWRVSAPRMST